MTTKNIEHSDVDEILESIDNANDDIIKPSDEELTTFKDQLNEYNKVDIAIKRLTIALKERRTHLNALALPIQTFMIKYGYDDINLQESNVNIKSVIKKVPKPIKLTDIRKKLEELGESQVTGEELLKDIFESERELQEKKYIKRILPKIPNSLII